MKKIILALLFIACITFHASAFAPHVVMSGTALPITTPSYEANYAADDVDSAASLTIGITATTTANSEFTLFAAWNDNSVAPSGATYDGNSMTLLNDQIYSSYRAALYRYHVASPASGSKNAVITLASSASINGWVAQFSGASSTQDEDSQEGAQAAAATQEITLGYSTSTNNCLLVTGVVTCDDGVTHGACGTPTNQTLFSDNEESGSTTVNGGFFDLSSAGAKNQCFKSNLTWKHQIAIGYAIKPHGS